MVDQTQPTFEMTPGFKPFTIIIIIMIYCYYYYYYCISLIFILIMLWQIKVKSQECPVDTIERLRFTFTPNVNLYYVTKFSPYFSFTVYCFYTKMSSFMPVLSTRIVLDCFYLLIFYSEKFSTDVCHLPYAVNVNLNLSNNIITIIVMF